MFRGAQIVTEGFTVPGVHPTPEVPVPLSATVCGDDESESLKESVPDRAPKTVGVNCTLIVQLPPAERPLPQLLLCVKSPLAVIEAIVRVLVEERVMVCAALFDPTLMLPNWREEGLTVALGRTLTYTVFLKVPRASVACTVSCLFPAAIATFVLIMFDGTWYPPTPST